MSDTEELHERIMAFLGGEFARKEGRMCTKLELSHAHAGFRGDTIKVWDRSDTPELFDDLSLLEKLIAEIIERTEQEADSFGRGKHRFVLRTHQYLGGRAKMSFVVEAGFSGAGESQLALGAGGDDDDMPKGVLGGAMAIISQQMRHNERHMQNQSQMFSGSLAVLARQNQELSEENRDLRNERKTFYKELEEARSLQDERDLKGLAQISSDKRKDQMLGKVLPLLPIVVARIAGKDSIAGGGPSGLAIIVGELVKSLRPEQLKRIAGALTMEQQILFAQAMQSATEQLPAPDPEPKPAEETAIATTDKKDKKTG